jgi:hypothetical protein
MFVCTRNYDKNILDLLKYFIVSVTQKYRSDIGSDIVLSRIKIYRHHNYAFHVRICWEQKYTVENKKIQEKTIQQFNVTQIQ